MNTIPPPRTYRLKTRLARCRARHEGTSKSSDNIAHNDNINSKTENVPQVDTNKKGNDVSSPWVKFNSGPEISSSWSGDSGDNEELNQEEVECHLSTPTSPKGRNWIKAPIHEKIRDLPAVPLPAPSSLPSTRRVRSTGASPLQQRDPNVRSKGLANMSTSFDSEHDNNSLEIGSKGLPVRKVVSRPIGPSRMTNSNVRRENTRRTRSRSRSQRKRSRSIIRVGRTETNKSDASSVESNSSGRQLIDPNGSRGEDSPRDFRRDRPRGRRERSLSIIHARRSTSKSSTRSRSLSLANSRSATTKLKVKNNRRENKINHTLSPAARQTLNSSSTDEETLLGNNRRRGRSVDPQPNVGRRVRETSFQDHGDIPLYPSSIPTNPVSATTTAIAMALNNQVTPSTNAIALPRPVHTRNLLTSSVYNNEATGIWITTINMNQKSNVTKSNAAKYLKAFSFHTEREARESAYANAPAKMMPFQENSRCFVCDAKFAVLRRASHCRNCGVCICSSCTVTWNKLSVPETYNVKNEKSVRVCKSCDSLSKMFRKALIDADYERALLIYNTGNINLRCQFMTVKGTEAMLPIHCAAEGGSLQLLQWLVDVHYCPIKRIRTGNRYKTQHSDELITTSKCRTILEIAMAGGKVDILNYLVNEKHVNFEGIRSLDVALTALQAVITSYPSRYESNDDEIQSQYDSPCPRDAQSPLVALDGDPAFNTPIKDGLPLYEINSQDTDDDSSDTSANQSYTNDMDSDDEQSVATTVHDACIICYDKSIDCVITPCGHQICCLECSKNLTTCPVCNVDCKFIKIFRP